MINLTKYRHEDIAKLLVQRRREGQNLKQYWFAEDQKVTMNLRPKPDPRKGIKEGSKRWNTLQQQTSQSLLIELQTRMLEGDYNAYIAFKKHLDITI